MVIIMYCYIFVYRIQPHTVQVNYHHILVNIMIICILLMKLNFHCIVLTSEDEKASSPLGIIIGAVAIVLVIIIILLIVLILFMLVLIPV